MCQQEADSTINCKLKQPTTWIQKTQKTSPQHQLWRGGSCEEPMQWNGALHGIEKTRVIIYYNSIQSLFCGGYKMNLVGTRPRRNRRLCVFPNRAIKPAPQYSRALTHHWTKPWQSACIAVPLPLILSNTRPPSHPRCVAMRRKRCMSDSVG